MFDSFKACERFFSSFMEPGNSTLTWNKNNRIYTTFVYDINTAPEILIIST